MKILIATMLFPVILLSEMLDITPNKISELFKGKSTEYILKTLSEKIANALPMTIDPATQLVNFLSLSDNLYIIKEIDTKHEMFEGEFYTYKEDLYKVAFDLDSKATCNNETYQFLFYERGVKVYFTYKDLDSNTLFRHVVGQKDCELLKLDN